MSVFSHYTSLPVSQQRALLFGKLPFWKDLALKMHLWFCMPCAQKTSDVLIHACQRAYGIKPDATKEDPWEDVERVELSLEEEEEMKKKLFRRIEEA